MSCLLFVEVRTGILGVTAYWMHHKSDVYNTIEFHSCPVDSIMIPKIAVVTLASLRPEVGQ